MQEQEPGRFDGFNSVPRHDDAAPSAADQTGGEAVPAWYPPVEYGPQPYPGPPYADQWGQAPAWTPEQPATAPIGHVVPRHVPGGERRRRLSRRSMWLLSFGGGLLVGAVAAVLAGGASLATHLYVNSVTLPRDKVQQQVAEVLTDAYQVGHVKAVSCPNRIAGGKGTAFVCSYTLGAGPAGKVIVTILNNQGGLRVERPST